MAGSKQRSKRASSHHNLFSRGGVALLVVLLHVWHVCVVDPLPCDGNTRADDGHLDSILPGTQTKPTESLLGHSFANRKNDVTEEIETGNSNAPFCTRRVFSYLWVSLLLASFIRAAFTEPGRPHAKLTSVDIYPRMDNSGTRTSVGKGKHCHLCNNSKPERAHHCRKCGRCVLKMDHHCPWIGNCVGFHNYKYYVLFLFYTVGSLVDASQASAVRIYCDVNIWSVTQQSASAFCGRYTNYGHSGMLFFTSLLVILAIQIVLGCAVGYLLIWHVMQLLHNCTTIEWYQEQKRRHTTKANIQVKKNSVFFCRKVKMNFFSEESGTPSKSRNKSQSRKSNASSFPWPSTFPRAHPYDLGWVSNIKAVFGKNWLFWPLPVSPRCGLGQPSAPTEMDGVMFARRSSMRVAVSDLV